jgi:orotidine-5'-phosphate decarboxylase
MYNFYKCKPVGRRICMSEAAKPPTNNVRKMLEANWSNNQFLCVGIDPVVPEDYDNMNGSAATELLRQGIAIVKATQHIAAAYKPNSAFFESEDGGYDLQAQLIYSIHEVAPQVPVIWDAKRGDIGKTNKGYLAAAERLHPQGITLNPYLGGLALKPLLEDENRMAFILAKTSNPGAGEFQNIRGEDGLMVWETVAHNVGHSEDWNHGSPMGIVVGATYPESIARARELAGDDVTILIPGVGTQGGDLEASVKGAKNSNGNSFLINVSSGISQPKDGRGDKLPATPENIQAAAEDFDRQIGEVL